MSIQNTIGCRRSIAYIKGVNKSYIAKLRRSVLLAVTQKIADEIDNPQEPVDDDIIVPAKQVA